MKYLEVLVTFSDLPEAEKAHIINSAINEFGSLGVEELNIDLSNSDIEDWALQSEKENLPELEFQSESLKFFYNDNDRSLEKLIEFLKSNYSELIASIDVSGHQSSEWENEWKKYLRPIRITSNLEVNFTKDLNKVSKEKSEIAIYPGMGFGTGNHETTYLCLKMMNELLKEESFHQILDFGCGSGILGILALKQFTTSADLFDIDEDALENCKQNLSLNLPENSTLLNDALVTAKKSELKRSYPFVVANILLQVLKVEKDFILEKSEKYLLLSGLLKTQEDEIIEMYTGSSEFKVVKIEYKNEWMAILLERVK